MNDLQAAGVAASENTVCHDTGQAVSGWIMAAAHSPQEEVPGVADETFGAWILADGFILLGGGGAVGLLHEIAKNRHEESRGADVEYRFFAGRLSACQVNSRPGIRQQGKWEKNFEFGISDLRFSRIVAGWIGSCRQRWERR